MKLTARFFTFDWLPASRGGARRSPTFIIGLQTEETGTPGEDGGWEGGIKSLLSSLPRQVGLQFCAVATQSLSS